MRSPATASVRLWPLDQISIECHWNNSAPGARDVNWGAGTQDEMCLGVLYIPPLMRRLRQLHAHPGPGCYWTWMW